MIEQSRNLTNLLAANRARQQLLAGKLLATCKEFSAHYAKMQRRWSGWTAQAQPLELRQRAWDSFVVKADPRN